MARASDHGVVIGGEIKSGHASMNWCWMLFVDRIIHYRNVHQFGDVGVVKVELGMS